MHIKLYKVLVRSRLEYGSVLWNCDIKTLKNKVERVQRKFLKFFCIKYKAATYDSSNYEELCEMFNIPPLYKRRTFHDMSLYKVYNAIYETPQLLSEVNLRVPAFNSRDTSLFQIPRSRVNVSKNSTMRRIMRTFNEIQENEKSLDMALPFSRYRQVLRACLF